MRSGALRPLSRCAPRSRDFGRRARESSATAVPGRRGRRLRCARLCARRSRRIPPRLHAARRCGGPSGHGPAHRPGPAGRPRPRQPHPTPRERHEERITLRIDLNTVVGRTGRAHDPAMIVECIAVPVAELVQQPRRPLDVREEERHHSTRELAWHATIISPRSTSVEGRLVRGKPTCFVYRLCAVTYLGWASFADSGWRLSPRLTLPRGRFPPPPPLGPRRESSLLFRGVCAAGFPFDRAGKARPLHRP